MQLQVWSVSDCTRGAGGKMGVHAAKQYARHDSMLSGGSCKQMMCVVLGGVELRIERTTSRDRWQFRDSVLNGHSIVVISGS